MDQRNFERKQDLNVLFQVCIVRAIHMTNMVPWSLIDWDIWTSSLKLLNKIKRNFTIGITQCPLPHLYFGPMDNQDICPSGWTIFDFSPWTTEHTLMKRDKKYLLNYLQCITLEFLRIIDIRIENFTKHPHLYKQPTSRSVKSLKRKMKKLHSKYVFTPTAKAANNVIWKKKYYVDVLKSELNSTSAYVPADLTKVKLLQRHIDSLIKSKYQNWSAYILLVAEITQKSLQITSYLILVTVLLPSYLSRFRSHSSQRLC